MAALKGFFDDSGKASDPRCSACAFGGYIGTCEQWDAFEADWKRVLDRFSVPWLHMKSFTQSRPPYERFKKDESRRSAFLQALISAIDAAGIIGFADGCVLDDVKRFNAEMGLALQPAPLCVSQSVCHMHDHLRYARSQEDTIEVVCDWFDLPHKTIGVAFDYLKHEPHYKTAHNRVSVSPALPSTWQNVAALQAADLFAYENYRSVQMWAEWCRCKGPGDTLVDFRRWVDTVQNKREWHGERRSAVELALASGCTTQILDYAYLQNANAWREGKWE